MVNASKKDKTETFPAPLLALVVYEWRKPFFRTQTAGQSLAVGELYTHPCVCVFVCATLQQKTREERVCVCVCEEGGGGGGVLDKACTPPNPPCLREMNIFQLPRALSLHSTFSFTPHQSFIFTFIPLKKQNKLWYFFYFRFLLHLGFSQLTVTTPNEHQDCLCRFKYKFS